jgi:uncharacterized membrane protein YhhN
MSELTAVPAFRALLIIIAVIFIAREWATFKKHLPLQYMLTPLITSLNLGFVILAVTLDGMNFYRLLILLALTASLIADVMLMLTTERMAIYGIMYFLGAHIIYIIAFASGYAFSLWHIPVAAALIAAVIIFYGKIGRKNKNMRALLLLYPSALCAAVFLAIAGLSAGFTLESASRALGALLFIASDICLGINDFAKPIKHSSVITWAAYAPAQFLFALSCF